MAAIVGSLALSSGPRAPARVWVPQSSAGHLSHRGGVNALSVDAMTGALPVNHQELSLLVHEVDCRSDGDVTAYQSIASETMNHDHRWLVRGGNIPAPEP